jgi:hypothetical protein
VRTVPGQIDRSKSRHERLLGSGTLLAQAAPGHVVERQPHHQEVALMAALSTRALAARGLVYDVPVKGPRALNRVREGP